jgi:hypothetical protein
MSFAICLLPPDHAGERIGKGMQHRQNDRRDPNPRLSHRFPTDMSAAYSGTTELAFPSTLVHNVGVLPQQPWSLTGRTGAKPFDWVETLSSDAAMRSLQMQSIPIIAGCGYDRPSAVVRSSPGAAGSYGCESSHMRLIVAVDGRQNENKALRTKGIGQNKKKPRDRIRSGAAGQKAFPRCFLEKLPFVHGWIYAESGRIRGSKAAKWCKLDTRRGVQVPSPPDFAGNPKHDTHG